jgi:DNA-binding NarL/FixJ family response regulator
MATTILIVDDHAPFRSFARRFLAAEGYEVVGEAGDAEEAVRAVRELSPDVVLLDIQLPGRDGFAVAKELSAGGSGPTVVLISNRTAADYRLRLGDTPAAGFVTKADLSAETLGPLVTPSA